MSTPQTDSVFDDFDDAQDYVIVARVGDRVRIVSSGRLEAAFVDRNGMPGDKVPEDAAEVGVAAAGFGGVVVRPRARNAAPVAAAPVASAPVASAPVASAPAPAPVPVEVPAVAAVPVPVEVPAAAPSFTAFVPPAIDTPPVEAGADDEDHADGDEADFFGEAPDAPADTADDSTDDDLADDFSVTEVAASDVSAADVPAPEALEGEVSDDTSDDEDLDDDFDESTGSGIDSMTHERIPSFATAPEAEPQLPEERLPLLDDVPDFDAIMSGESVIDPRDAQPEDDGVSALQGLFDPEAGEPASGPVEQGSEPAEDVDEDEGELDGEFSAGETEAYDRSWNPGIMPVASMTDYPPLERADPAPTSDDEDRIEETIRRGDPLLRATLDQPEEHLAVATLVLSTGEHLPITGTILIGRSPSVLYAYGDEPRLVTLDVGMTDISRNHLEVRLDGDQVLMRDMGSTNGTLLTRAGTPTVRLPSEAPIVGFPGDVFELGGALTVTIVAV